MRFLKKLFGSVSNSNKKNDYARATLEYATSPEIIERNTIAYNNLGLAFKAKGEYDRPISHYTTALKINTKKAIVVMDVGVAGLWQPRISVTFYRSYTSKTYLSISHC